MYLFVAFSRSLVLYFFSSLVIYVFRYICIEFVFLYFCICSYFIIYMGSLFRESCLYFARPFVMYLFISFVISFCV